MSDYKMEVDISANSSGFTSGINKSLNSVKSFTKGIQTATKALAGLFAINKIGDLTKSFVDMASGFQDATSSIIKGTGATGDALKSLQSSATESLINGVGRSTQELGGMIANLNTRFDVTGQKLNDMIVHFDKFSRVTGVDTTSAINNVAKAMKKWEVPTEQTEQVMDQLVKASQMSGISVGELTQNLTEGEAIFSQFGMGVTDTIAFLSNLEKNGVNSTSALTGLRTALAKFSSDGVDAQKGFEEISKKIKNAKTETEALTLATKTFGSKSGAEFVKILRSETSSLDDFKKALNSAGGTLYDTEERSRTTKDALNQLKSQITGIFTLLTSDNVNFIRDLIDDISEKISQIDFSDLEEKVEDVRYVFETFYDYFSALVTTLWENLKILADKISEFLGFNSNAFSNWKEDLYNILNNFYKYFQDAFSAISAILKGDWILAWEYAKLALMRIANVILDILSTIANAIPGLVNNVIKGLNKILEGYNKVASLIGKEPIKMIDPFKEIDLSKATGLEDKIKKTEKAIEDLTGKTADKNIKDLKRVDSANKNHVNSTLDGEIEITDVVTNESDKRERKQRQISESTKKKLQEIATITRDVMKNVASKVVEISTKVFNGIKDIVSGVVNFIKNLGSKVTGLLTKMFKFNTDEALDSLLAFEDSVLTFFVETLPKLPGFLGDAISSISTLIDNLLNIVSTGGLTSIFKNIINTIISTAPSAISKLIDLIVNIISQITDVLMSKSSEIIQTISSIIGSIARTLPKIVYDIITLIGNVISEVAEEIVKNADSITETLVEFVSKVIDGISNFIKSGGWKNLLNALITIQKALENSITENIDEIVNTIIDMLPDLMQMLIDSMISASQTLKKLIKPLSRLIMQLIDSLLEVLFSDEVFESALEVLTELIEAFFEEFLPRVLPLIVKLILKIINFIVKNLPKLISAIIKGLINGFANVNWGQVVADIFTAFIDGIKELFGIHSPSKLFEELGGFMVQGLVNGLKGLVEVFENILRALADVVKDLGSLLFDGLFEIFEGLTTLAQPIMDLLETISSQFFGALLEALRLSFQTLIELTDNILSSIGFISEALTGITRISFDGFNESLKITGQVIVSITESVIKLVEALSDVVKTGTDALGILGGGSSSGLGISVPGIDVSIPGVTSESTGNTGWDIAKGIGETILDPTGLLRKGANWVKGLFGWATGVNNAPAGLALVGEQGPELIDFKGGERVYNNTDTMKMLSESNSGGNNFNVTFNNIQDTSAFEMMKQLKNYQRNLAMNGVL